MRTALIEASRIKVGDTLAIQRTGTTTAREVTDKESVYPLPECGHKGVILIFSFGEDNTRYAALPGDRVSIVIHD